MLARTRPPAPRQELPRLRWAPAYHLAPSVAIAARQLEKNDSTFFLLPQVVEFACVLEGVSLALAMPHHLRLLDRARPVTSATETNLVAEVGRALCGLSRLKAE